MASSTTTTRNARANRMAGKGTTTATPRKASTAKRASAVTTRVDPTIVRKGKGKAKAAAKAAPAKGKAKAASKAKTPKAPKATTAAPTTTRQRPGDHGLVPATTGKLPAATTKRLLAAPKGDKATGLVYRSMRAQVSGGPVATVDNRKGQLGGKAAKGWLAVCLLTGAWGDYGSRHAAATAMAFPPAHGGASKG